MFQIYQLLMKQRDAQRASGDPGICGSVEDFRQSFEANPYTQQDDQSEVSLQMEESEDSEKESWMHHDSDSQLDMDDIKDLVAKQIQSKFSVKIMPQHTP